jgi:cytochrome c-type biogenesis protein CcmF
MHLLAYAGLLFALLATLFFAGLACLSCLRGRESALPALELGHAAACLLMLLSSLVLLAAFYARDYSFLYVFEHADDVLSLAYALSAFWAGQEGSLLLWAVVMAAAGVLFSLSRGYRTLAARTRLFFWVFFLTVQAFFLLLLTCWSNPFVEVVPAPADGRGLNPLLQNPGMIFHPPLLFLGYALYVIPACAALAAGIAGEARSWVKVCRSWSVMAWMFLTAGIILGGWWSYMELGWGGYWAWDPVENASLIPWFSGTAFLHTAIIETRRGALQRTNVFLMALTFILCVFATYLVRSGVVQSLHAFGEGGVGLPLLVFQLAGIPVALLTVFLGEQHVRRSLSGMASRQGLLVLAGWVFLLLGLVVGLGTMWPVISKTWSASPVGLDAGFYNRVCLPLFVLLVLVFCACPWLGWKHGVRDRAGLFATAGGVAAALAFFLLFAGVSQPLALVGVAAAAAAMLGIVLLFVRIPAMRQLRQLFGAHGVHLGLALIVLGVGFSGPYKVEQEAMLRPGETMRLGQYELRYTGITQKESPAMARAIARLEVSKNGAALGVLEPERRLYRHFDQPFAEAETLFGLGDELYAVLLGFTVEDAATLKVSVNPLINWIWIGGTLMCLAAFLLLKRQPGPA